MDGMDETKLLEDISGGHGMEPPVGEEPAEESFGEPATTGGTSEGSGENEPVDVGTAMNALVGEVGRVVDRVESRLTAKGQMAGIMLALATTILAILSGTGIHGTFQHLAVITESFAVFLGISVMVLILSASSATGMSEAIAEFNRGRYGPMMTVIFNNGTTLIDDSSTRDRVATILSLF